jgi:hypothetical protein
VIIQFTWYCSIFKSKTEQWAGSVTGKGGDENAYRK